MCHHHDNDFSVDYEGIRLTFGQHSGYSHYYRTEHESNAGGLFNIDHSVKYWKGIDFSRIDDYGDERGGTRLILRADGTFDITPRSRTTRPTPPPSPAAPPAPGDSPPSNKTRVLTRQNPHSDRSE